MSTQFKPGNEFIYRGKKWICLEPKRTRMTAIEMDTLRMASFPMVDSLEKTEGSWKNLIAAIEDALSNLKPGTTLKLESEEFTVKAVLRNGDIEAVSKHGRPIRIRKWSPWWVHFIPPECLPSQGDQAIMYDIANLRSHKRKGEAYSQLKKQGFEVIPYLLLNMGASSDRIKNASVKLVGGKGKLNLGFVKFPSTIDQHAFKLSSQIIADIAVEGYLKLILEMIENIDKEIRSQVVDDILKLNRCRGYTKESLEESIAVSLFSTDVVFQILVKKRGKESVDMLEKEAKHGRNQEHRTLALRYLKTITSNQARKAVARIEGKSVSQKKSSKVEKIIHNFLNRKTLSGRKNALIKLGKFGDSPEAIIEIFRQIDNYEYGYETKKVLKTLQQHPDAPSTLLQCFLDGKIENRTEVAKFLANVFENIKKRFEEIWPTVSADSNIFYLILESYRYAKNKGLLTDVLRYLQNKSSTEKVLCACIEYLQPVGSAAEASVIQHLLESSEQTVRHLAWKSFSTLDADEFLVWIRDKWQNVWDNGQLADQLQISRNVLIAASEQLKKNTNSLPFVIKIFNSLLLLNRGSSTYKEYKVLKTFFCRIAQAHSQGKDVEKYAQQLLICLAKNSEWNLFIYFINEFPKPWNWIATSCDLLDILERNIKSLDRDKLHNAMHCLLYANRDNEIRKMFRDYLPPVWPEGTIQSREDFSAYKKEVLRSLNKLEDMIPVLTEHKEVGWTEELVLFLNREIQSAVKATKEDRFGLFLMARRHKGWLSIEDIRYTLQVVIIAMESLAEGGESCHQLLKDMKERLAEVKPSILLDSMLKSSDVQSSLMDFEARLHQSSIYSDWINEFDRVLGGHRKFSLFTEL